MSFTVSCAFIKTGRLTAMKTPHQRTVYLTLFLAVAASFAVQVYFKDRHFQEFDSTLTYDCMTHFPAAAKNFYAAQYPDSFSVICRVRNPVIDQTAQLNLPFPLRSFFSLPLSTTYSPGNGLLYGVCTRENLSQPGFLSRALLLNIFVFHAGIIFCFLFFSIQCRDVFSASCITILLLFSYSLHHYTFHLGSTVWMFASTACFMYSAARFYARPLRMAFISAVLLLFNYLIVFFWLAWFAVAFLKAVRSRQKPVALLFSQTPFLLTALLVALVFYPPSQGFKAGLQHISQLPLHTYYIVLNFFTWYNQLPWLNMLCFVCILALFIYGCRLMRRSNEGGLLAAVTGIYFICVLLRLVDYAPSRQLLFWALPFFAPVQWAVARLTRQWRPALKNIFLGIFTATGIFCAITTNSNTRKLFSSDMVPAGANGIVLGGDCSYIKELIDAGKIISPGQLHQKESYLYLSQSLSFSEYRAAQPALAHVKIIKEQQIITGRYFSAFNPYQYSFTSANNLFICLFEYVP
jgi:hypothetical protein